MASADYPDPHTSVGAIERSLTVTTTNELVSTASTVRQVYPTTAAELWDAVTTSARLARWFGQVDGDFRLGGTYRILDNANGTIEACVPGRSFEATWEFSGSTSRIAVRVDAVGEDAARLNLEHTGVIPAEWWDQFGPGAGGVGWDLALLGLGHYLSTDGTEPLETTEWSTTEDAARFIAGSSRAWADASVATGTPEDAARAAEARTTAFYRGEEAPAEG